MSESASNTGTEVLEQDPLTVEEVEEINEAEQAADTVNYSGLNEGITQSKALSLKSDVETIADWFVEKLRPHR